MPIWQLYRTTPRWQPHQHSIFRKVACWEVVHAERRARLWRQQLFNDDQIPNMGEEMATANNQQIWVSSEEFRPDQAAVGDDIDGIEAENFLTKIYHFA